MKKINQSSSAPSLPRNYFCRFLAALTMGMGVCEGATPQTSTGKDHDNKTAYEVRPIGRVHNKKGQAVRLEIFKEFLPGLHRIDLCSHVTVIWWFHQNDTPAKRSILSVHPRGNKENPLTGVFATHSPVRPNLLAISTCKILSVKDGFITIDSIDAFDNTPILDLKSAGTRKVPLK